MEPVKLACPACQAGRLIRNKVIVEDSVAFAKQADGSISEIIRSAWVTKKKAQTEVWATRAHNTPTHRIRIFFSCGDCLGVCFLEVGASRDAEVSLVIHDPEAER